MQIVSLFFMNNCERTDDIFICQKYQIITCLINFKKMSQTIKRLSVMYFVHWKKPLQCNILVVFVEKFRMNLIRGNEINLT